MQGYLFLKQKLQATVGENMENNNNLRCHGGHLASKQTDNNNGYNRDIIKTGEYPDDLPKSRSQTEA